MPLRFHWRLVQAGEEEGASPGPDRVALPAALPDLAAQTHFCRRAEESGIDSLLVDFNFGKPEPLALALALALETSTLRFLVAHRPGLMSPTLFVQQINTFAAFAGGRISLNIVAGHSPREQRFYGDFLAHDERYARMDEFLAICHALWDRDGPETFQGEHYRIEDARLNLPFLAAGRSRPEVYLGGGSLAATRVAARRASCWMRFADTPERVREQIPTELPPEVEVGLRLSVIVRPTREEARQAAAAVLASLATTERGATERSFVAASDSVSLGATLGLAGEEWLGPCLWAGCVPFQGATGLALVGTPEEVAAAFLQYRDAGVSQFILSGWPKLDEMVRFGRDVLPLLRSAEEGLAGGGAC
jgi:alkanesulfonate monooxygenase